MPTYRYAPLITPISVTLSSLVAISAPAWSQIRGNHYINKIVGTVEVGRFLINPDQVTVTRTLSTSHQIRLGVSSQVTLNCNNGGSHLLLGPDTYQVSDYCSGEDRERPGSRNGARPPLNPSLPYVISPRNTVLMGKESLTLRWHPVEGAESYTVSIMGSGVNLRERVTEFQVTFSESDLSSIRPDYRYTVVIEADNGKSLPVGFAVLSEAERVRVNAQVEQIKAKGQEPDAEAIDLAIEYREFEHSEPDWRSYALNQAAIDVLEARIEAGTQNSQVYLLQADTYLDIELPLMAQRRYDQALALSTEAELRELQAESYLGLATVAEGQTEYGDAISYLRSAQQLYEELGDQEQIRELQTWIETIESQ